MRSFFFSLTHLKIVGNGHHIIVNILGDVSGLYEISPSSEGCNCGSIFCRNP